MSWLSRWFAAADEPQVAPRGDAVRIAEVEAVLAPLAPLIAADGGRIELVAVEGGRVHLRLRGACTHCSASDLTLQGVVEPRLRAALGWFEGLCIV